MGAIKLIGTAFEITGSIIKSSDFESWIEDKGKEYLEKQMSSQGGRWLFGRSRAKAALRKKIYDQPIDAKSFSEVLVRELNDLPALLASVAKDLKPEAPPLVFEEKRLDWILVLPRYVAVKSFEGALISVLNENAQLAHLPSSLRHEFLAARAQEAESLFFSSIYGKGEYRYNETSHISFWGGESHYRWKPEMINGHYYIVNRHMMSGRFDVTKSDKKFKDTIDSLHDKLHERVGRINVDELSQLVEFYDRTVPEL